MNPAHHTRTLALAGVFQSARLVQGLARRGEADMAAFNASIRSVLRIDAESAEAIYGGADGVTLGLTMLRDRLNVRTDSDEVEMLRYIVAIIQLERALAKHPDMLHQIGEGIGTIESQMAFFAADGTNESGNVHPALVDKLAELYSRTLSTLTPRIMVNGEHGHLSNPTIAARVRAALFAGIRSAVLWRQSGGRRWHLVFLRRRISQQASEVLRETGSPPE